jgi:hypothetical protein
VFYLGIKLAPRFKPRRAIRNPGFTSVKPKTRISAKRNRQNSKVRERRETGSKLVGSGRRRFVGCRNEIESETGNFRRGKSFQENSFRVDETYGLQTVSVAVGSFCFATVNGQFCSHILRCQCFQGKQLVVQDFRVMGSLFDFYHFYFGQSNQTAY